MDETADRADGCRAAGRLLAELATGAATGYERAAALRHAAGCVRCRRELAELARVADDLLLLVPERDPPPGFEMAVLDRIAASKPAAPTAAAHRPGRPRRSGRPGRSGRSAVLRVAAGIAAVLVAAAVGAGGVYWRGGADRVLAERYRQATTAGLPQPLAASTATGAVVGHVYLYPGSPSWVMVALTDAPAPGDYTMSVQTRDGHRYQAGTCTVVDGRGITGYPLPVPADQIARITLDHAEVHLSVQTVTR